MGSTDPSRRVATERRLRWNPGSVHRNRAWCSPRENTPVVPTPPSAKASRLTERVPSIRRQLLRTVRPILARFNTIVIPRDDRAIP